MPHIVIEYSKNLEAELDIQGLASAVHKALSGEDVSIAPRLKTRAIGYNAYMVGAKGIGGKMLHATLLLLEGRDAVTKKRYGNVIYAAMKSLAPEECAVTLEIRDMMRDSYYA